MKIRTDQHLAAVLFGSTLLLTACRGALAIVDDLDQPGSGSGSLDHDPTSTRPPMEPCACGSSDVLQPLTCDGRSVPLLDNDVVQTTFDGGTVAFNLCWQEFGPCEVFYWDGSGRAQAIGEGFMLGLSASGEDVLTTGSGPALELVHLNRGSTDVALGMLPGHGSLSASGDAVFGTDADELGRGFLARADVRTGEIDRLGQLDGGIARTYVNPDGTQIVGWTLPADITDFATYQAFRWSAAGGLSLEFPGLPANSWPEALSADGATVAGRAPSGQHFRWTEAEGYTEIGTASGRSETFISADGNVVLGSFDIERDGSSSAFRWTRATGAVEVAPGTQNVAIDMSDDGNVIIASSWEDAQLDGADPLDTFVWAIAQGTRTLPELLEDRGADTSGWAFGHARALSADGKVLLGRGECGGVPTLYRVVLSD